MAEGTNAARRRVARSSATSARKSAAPKKSAAKGATASATKKTPSKSAGGQSGARLSRKARGGGATSGAKKKPESAPRSKFFLAALKKAEKWMLDRFDDGSVWLTIRAFSRPATTGWWLVDPVLRVVQAVYTRRYERALAGPIPS